MKKLTIRTTISTHSMLTIKKEYCAGWTILLGLLVLMSVISTLSPKLYVPRTYSTSFPQRMLSEHDNQAHIMLLK